MNISDYSGEKIPAPWHLSGRGYIILYRFSRDFLSCQSFLPGESNSRFAGGLGAVMIVNYSSSEAGPYDELLFIPGKYRIAGLRWHTISKIYVSTMESVVNGRLNWGIPKELARFSFSGVHKNTESIEVFDEDIPIINASFKGFGISFPVDTRLLPFHLMQERDGKLLQTSFIGRGLGQLVRIKSIYVNRNYFPEVSLFRPLLALRVNNFKITFPIPKEISSYPSK